MFDKIYIIVVNQTNRHCMLEQIVDYTFLSIQKIIRKFLLRENWNWNIFLIMTEQQTASHDKKPTAKNAKGKLYCSQQIW